MTIHDFTTELFCRVDDAMTDQQKHSQAVLHPSELVTLGLLFALKGVGNRAFYRWAEANLAPLFPHLPERTRFFRGLAGNAPNYQPLRAKRRERLGGGLRYSAGGRRSSHAALC